MRHLLCLLALTGCYQPPDYGDTRFKCTVDRGCPPGQRCAAGYCAAGDGAVDAPGRDAPAAADAPTSSLGVLCGATTCAVTQKCCVDLISGPGCVGLTASCTGFSALCDGTEDCNGNPCCATGQTFICGTTCAEQSCLDAADCTNPGAPACCFDLTGSLEPWGRCASSCP